MTTFYVEPVQSGKIESFRDFAAHCLGAFFHEEDPLNITMPDGMYEELEDANQKLSEFIAMDRDEKLRVHSKWLMDEISYYHKAIEIVRTEDRRLSEMRKKVEKFIPPTAEHIRYKEFMLEQIDMCFSDMCFSDGVIEYLKEKLANLPGFDKWVDMEYTRLSDYAQRIADDIIKKKEMVKTGREWVAKIMEQIEKQGL